MVRLVVSDRFSVNMLTYPYVRILLLFQIKPEDARKLAKAVESMGGEILCIARRPEVAALASKVLGVELRRTSPRSYVMNEHDIVLVFNAFKRRSKIVAAILVNESDEWAVWAERDVEQVINSAIPGFFPEEEE